MKTVALLLALCVGLAGCKTVFDISPEAYASNDFTLVGALSEGPCKSLPVGGVDVCRVKEGSPRESIWRLILPEGLGTTGGQITVYYKDYSKVYPIHGTVTEIPFSDLIGAGEWKEGDSDVATALAEVRYRDTEGVERVAKAEGMAIIVVLKAGYDPMPMDSGQENWGLNCRVQYSTAGRSALVCK